MIFWHIVSENWLLCLLCLFLLFSFSSFFGHLSSDIPCCVFLCLLIEYWVVVGGRTKTFPFLFEETAEQMKSIDFHLINISNLFMADDRW